MTLATRNPVSVSKVPTTVRKLGRAFREGLRKDFDAGHPGAAWPGLWWWMPSGSMDTRGVRDGSGNSAVTACLAVKSTAFAEAPPRMFARTEGQDEITEESPAELLLRTPNPYMVWEILADYIIWATDVDGNAYIAKQRSLGGRVVELWPLIPTAVEPIATDGSPLPLPNGQLGDFPANAFIGAYRYNVAGTVVYLPPEDMIHLKTALDPENHRKGKGPIKTVLREILSDEEAGQYATALLQNMGVPGVIMSPSDPNDLGPDAEEAEAIEDTFQDKFGGRNRGRPMVMSGGSMKISVVSWSPQHMDFKTLRRIPEERISAVTGVPAILAGLGAGLDRGTYSNARTLREFMTEQKIAPLWRIFGAQLTAQLGPDFGLGLSERIGFDTTDVRALQEDEDAAATRWGNMLNAGYATQAEARTGMGLQAEEWHDRFVLPSSLDYRANEPTPDEPDPPPADPALPGGNGETEAEAAERAIAELARAGG